MELISIPDINELQYFDDLERLFIAGQLQFWYKINELMKAIDRSRKTISPTAPQSDQDRIHDPHRNRCQAASFNRHSHSHHHSRTYFHNNNRCHLPEATISTRYRQF